MIRRRTDIDGCGCSRCQDVDPKLLQRSLPGALSWSSRLPLLRPSILLVFVFVGVIQIAALVAPSSSAVFGAIVGSVGVFIGRGYIGVVGRNVLRNEAPEPISVLSTVLHRLPVFLGSIAVVVTALFALIGSVTFLRTPARTAFGAVGVSAVVAEGILLIALAAAIVYVFVMLCFLPEACFVGGYGPLKALYVSWTVATLQRRKAASIAIGFLVLLVLGVALDTQLADPASPVAVSFRYRETTVVLRSFGFSVASGVRFTFDLLVTMVYSGLFVHQYAHGILDP